MTTGDDLGEVIVEFTRNGPYLKCSAVHVATGREVSAMGPALKDSCSLLAVLSVILGRVTALSRSSVVLISEALPTVMLTVLSAPLSLPPCG